MYHNNFFTDEQWECIRVCVENAPIPYDRHHYKIVCKNKSAVVESWDEVQEWWWNNCRSPWFEGTVIHVIDKPKKKSKGFA